MAEISDRKSADAKTAKVDAAPIHETQNEQETVPEHIEGTSQTPKDIAKEIVHPPAANDDEVKGEDLTDLPEPHKADPQADPKDRTSLEGSKVKGEEKQTDRLTLKRVQGDEVYGNLGAPPSTQDALKDIRKRAEKSGEVS